MNIPAKVTLAKGTKLIIAPAVTKMVTQTTPEQSIIPPGDKIDFDAGCRFIDDRVNKTLSCILPGWPEITIMGTHPKTGFTAQTPYNPIWQDADAFTAFYAQMGLTVDSAGNGHISAPPIV